MKTTDPLLTDLVAESADPAFRQAMLTHTLAVSRRRRVHRQLGATALVALGLIFAAVLPVVFRTAEDQPTAAAHPRPEPEAKPAVRVLTDEELLSRFPDRAVALVGPPDRQRFVFLDTE